MLDQAFSLREQVEFTKFNRSKIITVTSGKGGVGKSNVVVNLAINLQRKGYRVLIFDADIGMANDDVLMGLYPKYSVIDLIRNEVKIEDIIVRGQEGVELLPGGSGINYIDDMSEKEQNIFLDKIASLNNYDYILIDTGAGINRNILSFIAASQRVILVTTPEPTSITDGYSLLKAINHFKLKDKVSIVVNKVSDFNEGNNTYNKYSNTIKRFLSIQPIFLGIILEDKKLVLSVKEQIPAILKYPNSKFAMCIEKISQRIISEFDIYDEYQDGAKGFFKNLFNLLG